MKEDEGIWPTSCNCPEDEDEGHPCPYLVDVYGEDGRLCTCCESCAQECANDI